MVDVAALAGAAPDPVTINSASAASRFGLRRFSRFAFIWGLLVVGGHRALTRRRLLHRAGPIAPFSEHRAYVATTASSGHGQRRPQLVVDAGCAVPYVA